jgi:ketosteroid isomerase-like protein
MSQENVEIVRMPLPVSRRSRRTLDERLLLRFPRLAAAGARMISKLPPGSRIRKAVAGRNVRLGAEAYNRRDLDAVIAGWHPDFEYLPDAKWVKAGLVEQSYRGADGYRRYIAAAEEVWGRENTMESVELIDIGDRLVILATVPMRAQASGVPLSEAYAVVMTLEEGRPIRLQEYFDHDEAFEAAGLSE